MRVPSYLCATITFTIFLLTSAFAEQLHNWNYSKTSDVNLWAKTPDAAFSHTSKEIVTPDGDPVLEVVLNNVDSFSTPEDIQLRYLYADKLREGVSYEIRFVVKASSAGVIQAAVAEADKPWTLLSANIKKVNVSENWQAVRITFTTQKEWSGPLALPRMMFGQYGTPATVFLGPVTLRELPPLVEYDTGSDPWTVFLGANEPVSFASIPEELEGTSGKVHGTPASPHEETLAIDQLSERYEPKDAAYIFKKFHSDTAGRMQIGVSADWWAELYVNGEKMFTTLDTGNISRAFVPDDHVIEIPVREGNNILAAKVLAGSSGWKFVLGKPSRGLDDDSLFIAKENADWKPLDMERMNVQPGTALDFSTLLGERTLAGEKGRVIINAAGRLAFEKEPERNIRFLSYNTNPWRLCSGEITKEKLDRYAADIARQGYNMIRMQGVDMFLLGVYRPPFSAATFGKPGWLPQRVEDIQFNPAARDNFDYLLASFKKHGIYVNLDLATMPGAYSNVIYPPSPSRFKTQIFFNPEYRQHWAMAITHLLQHINPHTGIALKDDPALAIVEPYNEQDLLLYNETAMREFTPAFRQYLKTKYPTTGALQAAWQDNHADFDNVPDITEGILRQGDARSADATDFLVHSMSEMTDWYVDVIRKAGYGGLITQWDMIMRTLEIPVRAKMALIAQHTYFEHPNPVPSKNLVAKSKSEVIWPNDDMAIGHGSSLDSSYYRAAAAIRFLDRPFLITEYSHSAPSRFRHERGIYFGSYAALQGWDSIAAHGSFPVVVTEVSDVPFCGFENPQDPISRASEAVATLAWLRGDVREAAHTVQLNLSSSAIFPHNALGAIGDDYAKLSMLTRLGIVYPEVKPIGTLGNPQPSLTLTPADFSPLSVNQWYASASNHGDGRFPELVSKLRENDILPEENKTDYAKRIYQSETGEILLDALAKTMTVSTARLEGAIVKRDSLVKLGAVEVKSCSKPASIVIASLEKDQPISDAKRLLLVFATNAFNSGETFENASMQVMVEVGKFPVLLETAKLTLAVKTSQSRTPKIYPLHLDGSRMEAIPASLSDGVLSLSLDTATLPYGAVFFEISFE